MTNLVFQLEFVGGPQDGLRAYSMALPDQRLMFVAGSKPTQSTITAYCRIDNGLAASYQFDHATLAGGVPNCLPIFHYHFTGMIGLMAPPHNSPIRRYWLPRWVTMLADRIRQRFRERLSKTTTYQLETVLPNKQSGAVRTSQ